MLSASYAIPVTIESVQQIAVGTEEVVKSFDAVSNTASVSAAETQTVSAATEEQLASTEGIAASALSIQHGGGTAIFSQYV